MHQNMRSIRDNFPKAFQDAQDVWSRIPKHQHNRRYVYNEIMNNVSLNKIDFDE